MDTGEIVVACANLVYQALGTGHTEIVYHRAMEVELRARVIRFESKVILPITYRGLNVGYGEADLVVYTDNAPEGYVVELKATTYAPRQQEHAQLRSYLRLRGTHRGIVVNFRQPTASVSLPLEVDWSEENSVALEEGIVSTLHAEEYTKSNNEKENKTEGEGC